jgi:hypothetical protein
MWLAVGLLLSGLAALPFDRFDPSLEKAAQHKRARRAAARPAVADDLQEPANGQSERSLAPVSTRTPQSIAGLIPATYLGGAGAWIGLLISNLRLMLKGQRWWWYAVLVGLWIASLASPLGTSRSVLLPLLWLWPLLIWSAMGCRENATHTDQLLFSCPAPVTGQFLAAWAAGALLALAAGSGTAIRMLLQGQAGVLLPWVMGALFIPSLAYALGSWTGSSKAFEVIYVILWYLGPMNHVPGLDFIGTTDSADPIMLPGLYLLVSLLLFAAGFGGRWIRSTRPA